MNGVLVMLTLLKAHAPLVDLVPVDSMVAGTVPQGDPLPAIGVSEVGRNDFQTLAQDEGRTLVRARIQVTAYTKDYGLLKDIIQAAKLGSGTHAGIVAGAKVRSVRRLGVGPDLSDEAADIFEQSRDFMVTYLEPI